MQQNVVQGCKRRADLRDPAGSLDPDGHLWSPWRHLALAKHYPTDVAAFVLGALGLERQRILDVGCGDGYLALEMTRAGHSVVGIDRREEPLETAAYTLRQAATVPIGELEYVLADFLEWSGPVGRFDAVVFSLSLHHMERLPDALEKAAQLLVPGGRIVCHEFGYDRLDLAGASWYQDVVGFTAALVGSSDLAEEAGLDPQSRLQNWLAGYAERDMHGFSSMMSALETVAKLESFRWGPFLYALVANKVLPHVPPGRAKDLVQFIARSEEQHIADETMAAIGFRYVGRKL